MKVGGCCGLGSQYIKALAIYVEYHNHNHPRILARLRPDTPEPATDKLDENEAAHPINKSEVSKIKINVNGPVDRSDSSTKLSASTGERSRVQSDQVQTVSLKVTEVEHHPKGSGYSGNTYTCTTRVATQTHSEGEPYEVGVGVMSEEDSKAMDIGRPGVDSDGATEGGKEEHHQEKQNSRDRKASSRDFKLDALDREMALKVCKSISQSSFDDE